MFLETVQLDKSKSSSQVAQLTAQYIVGQNKNVSEHTVHRTLLDMGSTRVPLLTKRYCQLHKQWAQEYRYKTMDMWKNVVRSDESFFIYCAGETMLSPYILCFENVLMGSPGTLSCSRIHHETRKQSEHNCGSVAPIHSFYLLNWKLCESLNSTTP
ncbi:uncharacterized protein TNCV_600241 [Trichonephila clavipes]|nr:uncharacterized protein TNCV_600241 [Trichonephila clavipes]